MPLRFDFSTERWSLPGSREMGPIKGRRPLLGRDKRSLNVYYEWAGDWCRAELHHDRSIRTYRYHPWIYRHWWIERTP